MSIIINVIAIIAFGILFVATNKKKIIFLYALVGLSLSFNLGVALIAEPKDEVNTNLPNNMYYLGVEIWSSETLNNGNYKYTFGCVDSEDKPHDGMSYTWISSHPLRIDVPYILTMENNNTEDVNDDSILIVWQLAD